MSRPPSELQPVSTMVVLAACEGAPPLELVRTQAPVISEPESELYDVSEFPLRVCFREY
jgi:hypothetical protein